MNTPENLDEKRPNSVGRRTFLRTAGAGAAAVAAIGGLSPVASAAAGSTGAAEATKESAAAASNRCKQAYQYRMAAAKMARQRPLVEHTSNGDESRYLSKVGTYSKGLPHNQLGEVDPVAYATFRRAIDSQKPEDWEAITLGGGAKLTSPQAGLAMDLQGADSHHCILPPAPCFDSAEEAGEAVELYWMALARDVNFSDYDTNPIIARAAESLTGLSDFRGPRENGRVTPQTIFRDSSPGSTTGHWLSQFLIKDFGYGALNVPQKVRTVMPGIDFMTGYQQWLDVQNGNTGVPPVQYDPIPRYMRNMRDMAQWVHVDALYQAYHQACLILLAQRTRIDPGLPLYDSHAQAGFAQCGGPHILSLVTEVSTRALKAVWYQKWFVHQRLRPEAFGGAVHNMKTGAASYPIHPDILSSPVLDETFGNTGSYLLPMAFPEGSPTHPSYGSGHATVAGACVTALKAFFDETDVIRDPVVPNADGTGLVSYDGAPLTVLGELDKVAMNVAQARNGAGVHWRTDAVESLKLGEEIAITILQEQKGSYNDDVSMTLTKFDGTTITI